MNHVILLHHLFLPYYVWNYGWMCFCCYFYSFILYRDFFSMKGAGLHPSVFFFVVTIVPSFSPRSSSLTKWQKAELSFFTTRHSPAPSSKLILFHDIPSHDQKGTPAVQIPFSYEITSMLVLERYVKLDMCTEQSLDPDPTISFGHMFCVQTSRWTKKGSSAWMYCYCFHSMGGVGVEREGEGKY